MTPLTQGAANKPSLVSPRHPTVRRVLRIAGPIVLLLGILFTATAFIDFMASMNGGGRPKLFWCGFVGMPLMFVGAVLCMFGFMGALQRYAAAESAPVISDTVNYLAENTQEGVKTVSKAVAKGVVEGMREAQGQEPPPKT